MQTWDYRIIDHGNQLSLHEVTYRANGTVANWSKRPVKFVADAGSGPMEIVEMLQIALESARRRPVLRLADLHFPSGHSAPQSMMLNHTLIME